MAKYYYLFFLGLCACGSFGMYVDEPNYRAYNLKEIKNLNNRHLVEIAFSQKAALLYGMVQGLPNPSERFEKLYVRNFGFRAWRHTILNRWLIEQAKIYYVELLQENGIPIFDILEKKNK